MVPQVSFFYTKGFMATDSYMFLNFTSDMLDILQSAFR